MPGPFIKFFQKSLGNKGLWDVLDAYPVKTATAVCTLAFVPAVHADPIVFEGVVEGKLVNPEDPKWKEYSQGFGWDSIFVPEGYDRPFSAMSLEEKCAISHRGAAVRAWANWMELNEEELRKPHSDKRIGHRGFR
jgi:inosine triphosphate pyrophosphatase